MFTLTADPKLNKARMDVSSVVRPDISRTEEFAPGHAVGNQTMLRRMNAGFTDMPARPSHSPLLKRQCACGGTAAPGGECAECKAKREAALKQQVTTPPATTPAAPTAAAAPPAVAAAPAKPTSENVWGFVVDRSMCGCKAGLRGQITEANTFAADYAACDVPANHTGPDVESCFSAREPTSVVTASTSPSGAISGAGGASNPCTLTTTGPACDRIEHKAECVHETMHARHTDDIARRQGGAFFAAWQRLAGDPNRVTTLRATFPTQVAAFESQWNDGHDWAQDEIHSYTWQRRFLEDALAALNRIC